MLSISHCQYPLHQIDTFVVTDESALAHSYTQSPQFTLGSTFHAVHSMDLDKYIIA